jgi:hypothetical protein
VPIVVPPFVQYQTPLFPLRGLWNSPPVEGDRFVSAEINWGVTTKAGNAVQFDLSGNSPVAFSQIVAFSVDNSQCASDVEFLFPDSGYVLNVPAYNQGVYPVFTNALMFYATAAVANVGDRTVFQVLNSMPPPVAIQPTQLQTVASVAAISLTASGNTQLIPATVSGTIKAMSISAEVGSSATVAGFFIQDGNGSNLWSALLNVTEYFSVMPIEVRFFNGLKAVVSGTSITSGQVNANIYYTVP